MNNTVDSGRPYTAQFKPGDSVVLKLLAMVGLLYLFILSITLLGATFKDFGGGFIKQILQATSNPVLGLMVGMLATAIVQSSSTTTSLIVQLVAFKMIGLTSAIPMVMGANIGTSVTNIIVSLGHISRRDEFRRAFTGSMLHDFFNVCAVAVLLPLEHYFHMIEKSAVVLQHLFSDFGGLKFSSFLGAITKPVAEELMDLTGKDPYIAIALALIMMFVALRYIVKVMKTLVLVRVEKFFQRYVFRTPILSFLLGVIITVLVQSSSITTSIIVPLLGAGVLNVIQIYPYLLGANVGTTITAFLASFVTGSPDAVAVAFAHLVFNIFGIAIFWPLKRVPIYLAETLGKLTTKSKLVPILYIVVVFFLIPGIVIYFME